jgi:hypothetical protein
MKVHRILNLAFAGTLAAAVSVFYVAVADAQVQTSKTEQAGQSSQKVTVERGEVVWASGNNAMIKMESGELKLFENIPESARVTVDGKQLNVHQLTPGMKLERTTITTSTPKTVRTTKSVTGTIWHVNPPNQVILTMDDKTNQSFTIPKGQKFNIDGKETDAYGLRKGMKISVSAVTEETQDHVSQQVSTTGVAPPPPPAPEPPPPNVAILIVRPTPTPVAAAPVPTTGQAPAKAPELPKTASPLPLTGLLALGLFTLAMGVRWLRLKTAGVR